MSIVERWFKRKERLPEPFAVKSLEDLSPSDLSEFRRKVKKNKGIVQILVHPFYNDNGDGHFPISDEYRRNRDEFIRQLLLQDEPLIIFEEDHSAHMLSGRIDFAIGTVYLVPTLSGDARPASMRGPGFHPLFMNSRVAASLEFNAWRRVTAPLKSAGVKYAIVGGRYMVLEKPETETERRLFSRFQELVKGKKNAGEIAKSGIYPSACPGHVMNALLVAGIDVSISSVSSPTNAMVATQKIN